MPPRLTKLQKERLGRLEGALRKAVVTGDYPSARNITADIQSVLRTTGHETRLMQAKSWLFEAALMAGEVDLAIQGFIGVRGKTSRRTRVYLEATALLALCYIRKGDLVKAEPLIAEVLRDDKHIKNLQRRREFHRRIIQRFDEEGALSVLVGRGREDLNPDEIHEEAVKFVQTKSEDEIFAHIGENVPREVVDFILKVDQLSRNQLLAKDIRYLPAPGDLVKKSTVGRNVFGSFKRVLYRSLCDPESDIYKAWSKGMGAVLSGKYIAFAVVAALYGSGLGYKALAVSATALVMKFGIEVFCEQYRPVGVMETGSKKRRKGV
jgi:hypothetical protein